MGVISFKGIRYAVAGRFEYPVETEKWYPIGDVRECQKSFMDYKDAPYQIRAFRDEATIPDKQFHYKEFREGIECTYSEDCLYLNIWTSLDENGRLENQKKPVLVYIHGGSFMNGASNDRPFDGTKLAEQGIVVVTINYRLGPLGFMCLPELEKYADNSGNYGLYDQLTALQWVNHNIDIFGGDPENVTIMGQSAGAMSVTHLIMSSLTKGLFAKAVMSSGGGLSSYIMPLKKSEVIPFWENVKQHAGVNDTEELKALSVEKLYEAFDEACNETKKLGLTVGPVFDNNLIKKTEMEDYESGNYNHIPIIIGSNSEDIVSAVMYGMVDAWGRRAARFEENDKKCYAYHFSRSLPGDDKGAWHGADLWYWFGNLEQSWRPWEEVDEDLSERMMRYLINFIETSDPNQGLKAHDKAMVVWESSSNAGRHKMQFSKDGCSMGGVSFAKTVQSMLFKKNY